MVSVSVAPMGPKKGKQAEAAKASKPKKVGAPQVDTTSWDEPSRFALRGGRRATAADRVAAMVSNARKTLDSLPGGVSSPKELAEMARSMADAAKEASSDPFAAPEALEGADPRGISAEGLTERTKAGASRLMDLTSSGPVRVRGSTAQEWQTERQAVFREAQARREFLREVQHNDDGEEWAYEGTKPAAVPLRRSMYRRFGIEKQDVEGANGQRYDLVVGENDLAWLTDDESHPTGLSKPFGTAPLRSVKPSVVEELSQPIKYVMPLPSDDSDGGNEAEPTLKKDHTRGSFGIVDPRLSPEEQELDAERRALRAKFLDPLPIPNAPIHQQFIYLADSRQHHKVSDVPGLSIRPGDGFHNMRFLKGSSEPMPMLASCHIPLEGLGSTFSVALRGE
jgi:hypothetical protein